MMYFKSLIDGLSPLPGACPVVRAELESQAKQFGWPHLHQELAKVDPQAADKISENDSQRINRALEVYRISGKTMTELQKQKQPTLPYTFHQFAIAPDDRSELHQRIEKNRFLALHFLCQIHISKVPLIEIYDPSCVQGSCGKNRPTG